MKIRRHLLLASIVGPFYRENGGVLCFVYYIMFLAVGKANGVALLDYHYSLITGMLNNYSFLLVVYAAWMLYTLRCCQFFAGTVNKPEFRFLHGLALLSPGALYLLLLITQSLMFMPVLSYLLAIAGVGYYNGSYAATTATLGVAFTLVIASTGYFHFLIRNPDRIIQRERPHRAYLFKRRMYLLFLLRYLSTQAKLIFVALKLYSCGVLYLLLDQRNPGEEQDIRLFVFFYCVGMLAHGIIIHRMKEIENTRMNFYRLLPIRLHIRFLTYAALYLAFFLPELLLIITRVPVNLGYFEAALLSIFGYGVLLLLNSLQLFNYTGIKQYFTIVLQVFILFILALITKTQDAFFILVFMAAIVLFFARYDRFEPQPNNVMR